MMKKLFVAFLLLLLVSVFTAAHAQDPAVLAGAKKEGEVFLYTGKSLGIMQTVSQAFEKKYPFLKVRITRTSGEGIVNRIRAEKLAGKILFDAVSTIPVGLLEPLNVIKPYCSPEAKVFPAQFKHPNCLYTTLTGNYYVILYNTRMVPEAEAPKDWDDLLAPKWRQGQIALDPEEYSWFAGMEQHLGEEKTRKLMSGISRQGIRWQKGHSNLVDLTAAGEFPLSLSYATRTEVIKEKGAPIQWVRTTKPIITDLNSLAISAQPIHPNAAILLIDFLLSEEAQKIFFANKEPVFRPGVMPRNSSLNPANLEVAPVPAKIFTPTVFKQYQAKFDEIFGPRR
jgi:iron(III) transport system substrate-binding protein